MNLMDFSRKFFRSLLLIFIALHSCGSALAQETCGNILGEENGEEHIVPIEDCLNPFGPVNINSNLEVAFGATTLADRGVYEFLNSTETFELTGTHPLMFTSGYAVYRNDGSDYRKIAEGGIEDPFTFTAPGTYSLVIYEDTEPILSKNFLEKLMTMIVPTAHAFPGISLVLTFEVIATSGESPGISNILFLPGMKGSRLYTKDGEDEMQLWEPFGSEDYENLRMTEEGESLNNVYTRDVVDSVYGGIGGDVYASFIEFLNEIDGENGPLVEIFPYDWRYSVTNIVENGTQYETGLYKKLVETVDYLATLSDTDKVTIIAHSNGGHIAKVLMLKLEEIGKVNQVDKVIFIATPHIGTPKAIAALLHGYDEEYGMNIPADAGDIRRVIKNMPGPYGLLPSEAYVSILSEPLISFDNSTTTKQYRDRYGFTVNTMSEYRDFLNGIEGRLEDFENVALPGKTNSTHLDEALEIHSDMLDPWQAPDEIEVFNIVGIGLKTPNSIEYREFVQDYCGSPGCILKKLEPVVGFTLQGDETVVAKSSESVQSSSQVYINLGAEEEYEHANITEAKSVQIFVDKVLHGSSTDDIDFISTSKPTFDTRPILVKRIHSPARIYIEDADGRRTGRDSASGRWKEEIPETNYYEIGGVKYILVPKNIAHRVFIEGEGSGAFTHVIDELVGEEQTTLHTFVATVTPTTRASYAYLNGTTSLVSIDQNGDATTDYQLTIDGIFIDTKAIYPELRNAVQNLKLVKPKQTVLLSIVDQADQFYKKRSDAKSGRLFEKLEEGALVFLDQALIQLRKVKIISPESYQGIKIIIDKLIKQ